MASKGLGTSDRLYGEWQCSCAALNERRARRWRLAVKGKACIAV
jgi:hypothetical protein